MLEILQQIDTLVFVYLHKFHYNKNLDQIMLFLADFKHFLIPTIILALYIMQKKKLRGILIVAIIGFSVFCTDQITSKILKPTINRTRPCHVLKSQIRQIQDSGCNSSPSFPSSHASNSLVAALLFFFFFKRRKWLTLLLISSVLLVAWSRIYLGVHYPSDILAGWIIAILVAYPTIKYRKKLPFKYAPAYKRKDK